MRYVVLLLVGLLGSCGGSARVRQVPQLAGATELVWLGIDYTGVKMVGLEGFNRPDEIFPSLLKNWNGLFVTEMLPDLRERVKKPVRVDVEHMIARNRQATRAQIIEAATLGENLRPADVKRMVASYNPVTRSGVGLVLIMDLMLKHEERACLYATFVDLASRTVLDSQRVCHATGGFGFRNYWFSPIKEAVRTL